MNRIIPESWNYRYVNLEEETLHWVLVSIRFKIGTAKANFT